ncbi:MAG: PGPGW domain-containing protein [Candidatus Saccharimonadales bacterium]
MSKATKLIRKLGVLIVGVPLFILGVILIPLPGPGLLVCFAALVLISMEFDQAKPHVHRIRKQMNKVVDISRTRAQKFSDKHDPASQAPDNDKSPKTTSTKKPTK